MNAQNSFDFDAGQRAKERGMNLAAGNHHEQLELLRSVARRIAREKKSRETTADDVLAWFINNGGRAEDVGAAAGSIFRGGDWEAVGWVSSARVSNHNRAIRVWRLKDGR